MIPAVFSRFLSIAALAILPIATANSAWAQDLGIDCHVPRTTLDGRLVFDPEGQSRALCEADRATALNYSYLLQTVRDQVTFRRCAPCRRRCWPILSITWRPTGASNSGDPNPQILISLASLANVNPDLVWNAADRAAWEQGILAGSGIDPDDWGIQARACGPEGQGQVVVWMDPASLRGRWTPAMVQRTTYAWMEAREGLVAIERTPKITAGVLGAPATRRIDGHERELDVCFDTMDGGTQDLPRGALAMDATLRWRIDTETDNTPCTEARPGRVPARTPPHFARGLCG